MIQFNFNQHNNPIFFKSWSAGEWWMNGDVSYFSSLSYREPVGSASSLFLNLKVLSWPNSIPPLHHMAYGMKHQVYFILSLYLGFGRRNCLSQWVFLAFFYWVDVIISFQMPPGKRHFSRSNLHPSRLPSSSLAGSMTDESQKLRYYKTFPCIQRLIEYITW